MASSTSSISGLVSGLDTATIIDQLMRIEGQSQTRLKSELTTQQSTLKTLQGLNAKIAALVTQATTAGDATAWSPTKVTSSDAGVTARSTSGVATALDLHVQQVATATRVSYQPVLPTDTVVSGSPVQLTVGSTTTTLNTGNGSLGSLVAAINGGSYGVSATTVRLPDGTERLSLQASTTGGSTSVSLSNVAGLGTATTTAGQDAQIVVGPDTLASSSNTFTAVAGLEVSISAAAVGKDVHLDVTVDTAAVKDKAKSLVDNLNAVLTQLDGLTSYDATTKTRGALAGDAGASALRTSLFNAVFPSDGTSMAAVGIQTDRYGKLVFDADAFDSAYAADPAKVTTALSGGSTGFADRLAVAAKAASDSTTGSLTSSITGRSTAIKRTQDSIDAWDLRLELRRSTLTRQFTALETALNQMNSQSSWLSGQLSSLSATKSS